MADKPHAIKELKGQLGRELARHRAAAGLTQRELAAATYVSRSYVSHAEAGREIPNATFWARADAVLDANGSLLARFNELHRAQLARRRTELDTVGETHELTFGPAGVAAGGNTVAVRGLTTAPQGRTTPSDLAAIRAMTRAFQAADRQAGGGHLYRVVVQYLNAEIGPRLLLPVDATVDAQLFAAAASLTEIAAWMAHDGGSDGRAREHLTRAFGLAQASRDPALTANIYGSMSHIAGQCDQWREAVLLAEAGLAHASQGFAHGRLRARLHAMHARALAATGQAHASAQALDKAADALAADRDSELPDWVSYFDEASLASEAALCWRQLGHPARAARDAEHVIKLRADDRVRSKAFARLTFAAALVDTGDVEHAAVVGQQVCSVAPALASTRVRQGLDQLGHRLAAHRRTSTVADFLDRLRKVDLASLQASTRMSSWPV